MQTNIIRPHLFDRDQGGLQHKRQMQSDLEKLKNVTKLTERLAGGITPPDDYPRVNAYVCDKCGHVAHTVDVSKGTTPMSIPCMSADDSKILSLSGEKAHSCGGAMMSGWYSVMPEDIELDDINYEWRSPSLEFYRKMLRSKPDMAEHIARGGLLLHQRTNRTGPMMTHGDFYVRPDGTRLSEDEEASLVGAIVKLKEFVAEQQRLARRKADAKAKQKAKARAKRRKGRK